MPKIRVRLANHEAIALGFEIAKQPIEGNPKYTLNDTQFEQLQKLRNFHQTEFKEVRRNLNKKGEITSTVERISQRKLVDIPVNHEIKRLATNVSGTQQWVITEPKKPNLAEDIKEIDFTAIFKDLKPIEYTPKEIISEGIFDRFVYSDVHVGMNIENNSLYGMEWNEKILNKRLEICIIEIINERKSEVLIIDDLGDLMDGWDAMTTRGGHKLPQNMDNQEAFDVALKFKIKLIQSLIPHYSKIICNNVCNDNHGGAFSYVVNSAFKTAIQLMYPNVEVNNLRKFMEHYEYKNHIFVLCHGKDDKHMKFGFPIHLDPKTTLKIDNYIKDNYLHKKGVKIEFSKGNDHQYLFDNCTSQIFNYYNYPCFSNSSAWVQGNFQKGKSGSIFFNYYENSKKINEIIFDND